MKTIMYCHGRGSTGRGTKATIIKGRFAQHNFVGNDYPTNDPIASDKDGEMPCDLREMKEFWRYVQMLTGDIKIHKPDVIVASSFGGAALTRVIIEGGWTGPTVFLAQAAHKFGVTDTLPVGYKAIYIHGTKDDTVKFEGSAVLAGTSKNAKLVAVNDGHRLYSDESREAYLAAIAEFLQD